MNLSNIETFIRPAQKYNITLQSGVTRLGCITFNKVGSKITPCVKPDIDGSVYKTQHQYFILMNAKMPSVCFGIPKQ